jgi:hypothetical protein
MRVSTNICEHIHGGQSIIVSTMLHLVVLYVNVCECMQMYVNVCEYM